MTDFKEADIDRAVRQVILAMNAHQWTAVGYLAEAAEACLPNHLSAAEELRLERLVLMDDPTYRPDYKSLLTRLQGLK